MKDANRSTKPAHFVNSPRMPASHQHGASLIVCLLMLVAILMLGLSSAGLAIQGEKSARSDRDRQIAWTAAAAALSDAELDISSSPDPSRSRSAIFSEDKATGFPMATEDHCHTIASPYFGLCRKSGPSSMPSWLAVDYLEAGPGAYGVPYGTFTGRSMQTGSGSLPGRLPRYVIELIPVKPADPAKTTVKYIYRITAVGFGVRDTTQVMLQTYYRKAAALPKAATAETDAVNARLSWREVSNWQDLRHAALYE